MKPIQNRFTHKISGKVKCQLWTIVAYHLTMQMTVCGLVLKNIKGFFIKALSEHSHTHSFIPVPGCSCSSSQDKKLGSWVYTCKSQKYFPGGRMCTTESGIECSHIVTTSLLQCLAATTTLKIRASFVTCNIGRKNKKQEVCVLYKIVFNIHLVKQMN